MVKVDGAGVRQPEVGEGGSLKIHWGSPHILHAWGALVHALKLK